MKQDEIMGKDYDDEEEEKADGMSRTESIVFDNMILHWYEQKTYFH